MPSIETLTPPTTCPIAMKGVKRAPRKIQLKTRIQKGGSS
jgi:hypothetical protein